MKKGYKNPSSIQTTVLLGGNKPLKKHNVFHTLQTLIWKNNQGIRRSINTTKTKLLLDFSYLTL